MADKKRSKREDAKRELRMLEKEISGGKSLIDYGKVNQRHMDDNRFERELKNKEILQEQADYGAAKGSDQAPSATYDAFMRMQTGQETRTIADKINDPNRVSWEQFRKDNADKLDIPGADRKKMVEYRAQLDAEREAALAKGRNRPKRKLGVSSSSESDGEENDGGGGSDSEGGGGGDGGGSSSTRRKKKTKKDKKLRKESSSSRRKKKKHKSSKRSKKSKKSRRDGDDSGGSTDSDGESESEESRRRRRREKKSKRKEEKEAEIKSDPRRLSEFLNSPGSGSD